MTDRYQIEDLLRQDAASISYRGVRTADGLPVVIRRFAPYGLNGGGLPEPERAAFAKAVGIWKAFEHPFLIKVLDGGCDAIDGHPFLVTEEPGDPTLAGSMREMAFTTPEATGVLQQVFDLSGQISAATGVPALWLDLQVPTAGVSGTSPERKAIFLINPAKWWQEGRSRQNPLPLVRFTENLMGWRGKTIPPTNPLGNWLKWLRAAVKTATLAEAKNQLFPPAVTMPAVPRGVPSRGSTLSPGQQRASTYRPPANAPVKPAAPRRPFPVLAVLILVGGVALGGSLYLRRDALFARFGKAAEASASVEAPRSALDVISSLSAEKPLPEGVIPLLDQAQVAAGKGGEIVGQGTFSHYESSDGGATLYLHFSRVPLPNAARGVVRVGAAEGLDEAFLKPLLGKQVRIKGKVVVRNDRPEIELSGRDSVEPVP